MRRDVVSLQINPSTGSVPQSTRVQLNLVATHGRGSTELVPGNTAVWSTSNTAIAEVNRQGQLVPRALGAVTITARCWDQVAEAVFAIVPG